MPQPIFPVKQVKCNAEPDWHRFPETVEGLRIWDKALPRHQRPIIVRQKSPEVMKNFRAKTIRISEQVIS